MVVDLPDTENNPFLNGQINAEIEDKLFKHVLFNTQINPSKFRITSVGHDWTAVYQVNTNEVKIPLESWDFTKNKFRIRSVLSEPDHGVLESDWVSQQVLGEMEKRKLNQFRVRGVSDKGLRSKWVYSELIDEDNDLVVFQLLHDLLDIMTITHEHDFNVLLDTSLVDTLIGLMNGGRMDDVKYINTLFLEDDLKYKLQEAVKAEGMGTHQINLLKKASVSEEVINEIMQGYFKFQESKKTKIQEAAELVAKYFKKNFMEQKKFSAEDIATHAKLYNFKDVRQDEVLDHMLDHIFLITVEDCYEKALEEASLIAFLQNDEEIQYLLTDMYEFKAESSLIALFHDVEFVDSFVTFFSDGLELFLESNFLEDKITQFKEEAIPTLLLVYKDIYIPMAILDSTVANLFSDIDDDATEIYKRFSSQFSNIKFEYFDESTGNTWTLIEDYLVEIFEYLLLTDDKLEKHLDVDLFSTMIGALKKDSINLFITYDPVEAIEFISKIGENLKISAAKLKDMTAEEYHLYLQDNISMQDLTNKGNIEVSQKLKHKEDVLLTDTNIYEDTEDILKFSRGETYQLFDLSNFKKILENYSLLLSEGYTLKEILSNKDLFLSYNLSVLDQAKAEGTKKEIEGVVSHYIAIYHTLLLNNTKELIDGDYTLPAYGSYHLELLYKHNLLDLFTGPFVRRESEEEYENAIMTPHFYRYDDYFNVIWNIREDIHVHLGELDLTGERFPLGYFVLGQSTLEGESNSI